MTVTRLLEWLAKRNGVLTVTTHPKDILITLTTRAEEKQFQNSAIVTKTELEYSNFPALLNELEKLMETTERVLLL